VAAQRVSRVKVYTGIDPVTGKENYLRELVKARRTQKETEREAEKVVTKLYGAVGGATVLRLRSRRIAEYALMDQCDMNETATALCTDALPG